MTDLGNQFEPHISYSRVKEIYDDESSTVYEYLSQWDIKDEKPIAELHNVPSHYSRIADNSLLRGRPKSVVSFSSIGEKVHETDYLYRYTDPAYPNKNKPHDIELNISYFDPSICDAIPGAGMLGSMNKVFLYKNFSTQATTTTYRGGFPIEVINSSEYQILTKKANEYLKLKSSSVVSGSLSRITDYAYVDDVSHSQSLLSKDATGIPLEVKVNNGQGGGSKVEFDASYRPNLIYEYNIDGSTKLMSTLYYDDSDTYPDRIKRRRNREVEFYTWRQTGAHKGLLDNVRLADRVWNYGYDDNRFLSSTTDFNGFTNTFAYDGLQRLSLQNTNSHAGDKATMTSYVYNYGRINGGVNKITASTQYGTFSHVTEDKYDGLGRHIEEKRIGYTQKGGDFTRSWTYDHMNRVVTSCDPAKGGCDDFIYYENPLEWLKEQRRAGYTGVTKFQPQGVMVNGIPCYKTLKTDEDNRTTAVAQDILGNRLQSTINGTHTTYRYNARD